MEMNHLEDLNCSWLWRQMSTEDSDALRSLPSCCFTAAAIPSCSQCCPGCTEDFKACGVVTVRLAQKAPLPADVLVIFVQHLHYGFLFVAFLMVKRPLGGETSQVF